jgi:hypothetical protein
MDAWKESAQHFANGGYINSGKIPHFMRGGSSMAGGHSDEGIGYTPSWMRELNQQDPEAIRKWNEENIPSGQDYLNAAGSKLQATYADLAEYYEADNEYEPGTVLEFGGEKEVTLAQAMTPRVAGVVSTNPAYVMNSTCEGEHIVAIALQGRVPCKVRGTIRKGDLLISDVGGFARPSSIPLMGTVIGKSLENFEGEGVIEVAVGRL